MQASATSLKPIDRAALQSAVDTAARKLMVPGALVLLRMPQGEFILSYGTTELSVAIPPSAATHFRIASNTKTMTAAVIMLLARRENSVSMIQYRNTFLAFRMETPSAFPNF